MDRVRYGDAAGAVQPGLPALPRAQVRLALEDEDEPLPRVHQQPGGALAGGLGDGVPDRDDEIRPGHPQVVFHRPPQPGLGVDQRDRGLQRPGHVGQGDGAERHRGHEPGEVGGQRQG
jgi:hypothetical protein